jgi:hypothetical protein
MTYRLSDVGLGLQSAVEAHAIILGETLNDLTTSDVLISLVIEKRGNEDGRVGEVASVVCTIENMVGQKS